LIQFRHAGTLRFRQVQRGARGAVAVHITARDRNGAPGSALHFKRLREAWCLRLLSLRSFTRIGGKIAKIVHLCIDRTRRVSPNYHHSPRMSPWLHSCGNPRLIRCCTRRLLFGWAGKISSVLSRFELFLPYHARLGEWNLVFLADSRCVSELYII